MSITKLFTIVLILIAAFTVSYAAVWKIETIDIQKCDFTAIALDSTDQPQISYCDDPGYYEGYIRYAHYSGNNWHIETVNTEEDGCKYSSLALDSSDQPHISYIAWGVNQQLKYARYYGSAWSIRTISESGTGGFLGDNSIALDSSDQPHISYYHHPYDQPGRLGYAYDDGSGWQRETVDSPFAGEGNSIAIDSYDRPHISYIVSSSTYTQDALKYAYYNGSSWQIVTVDADKVVLDTSIALDSSNQPHITYTLSNGDLRYAHYNGSAWQIEVVDTNLVKANRDNTISIALDSSDKPHISYMDWSNYFLKYAHYDSTRQTENVDLDVDYKGGYSSIALDSIDQPHISYSGHYGNLNHATLYDYPRELKTKQFSICNIYPNPVESSITCILTNITEVGEIRLSLYDLSGRWLQSQKVRASTSSLETTLDVSTLAPGVYTLEASMGAETAVKRVVVAR